MLPERNHLRVMIVQKTGIYNQLEDCVALAHQYIEHAGEEDVDLIIFGEGWLTGYPVWLDCARDIGLWDDPSMKSVYSELWHSSVTVDGAEMHSICQNAKQQNVMICLGFNERVKSGPGNRSLYNSFVLVSSDGEVIHHHRKTMPTHTERLVHAQGDGRGLKTVETPWGRIGGLICWEHWMPLTRQALHEAGETIHIALWPNVHEMLQVASRHYAFEGRCFVIAAGQSMQAKQLPGSLIYHDQKVSGPNDYVLKGQTCIFGPNGHVLLHPQPEDKDVIIYDIENLDTAIKEQMTLDVSGHYNRPDLFEFNIKA